MADQQYVELRHFRYFIVAAEEQNLHKAAERLHIAQSALSRQIKDLENDLGVELFERYQQRIRLSEAGRVYFEGVKRILSDVQRTNEQARSVARGQSGSLRVSIHYVSLRNPTVPQALRAFRMDHPDVKLTLSQLLSTNVIDALRADQIDAGIVLHHRSDDNPDLDYYEVGTDHFVLAMPSFHPLADKNPLVLADLANEPFLWTQRSVNTGFHDRLMAACHARGLTPVIAQEVLTQETSPELVSVGMGLAFVLASSQKRLSNVLFKEVFDLDLNMQLDLVWRRGDRSPTLARFIETLSRLNTNSATPIKTMPAQRNSRRAR